MSILNITSPTSINWSIKRRMSKAKEAAGVEVEAVVAEVPVTRQVTEKKPKS